MSRAIATCSNAGRQGSERDVGEAGPRAVAARVAVLSAGGGVWGGDVLELASHKVVRRRYCIFTIAGVACTKYHPSPTPR